MKTAMNLQQRLRRGALLAVAGTVMGMQAGCCNEWFQDCTGQICQNIELYLLSFVERVGVCCMLPEHPNPADLVGGCEENNQWRHCCFYDHAQTVDEVASRLSGIYNACVDGNCSLLKRLLKEVQEALRDGGVVKPGVAMAEGGWVGNHTPLLPASYQVSLGIGLGPREGGKALSAIAAAEVGGRRYLVEAAGRVADELANTQPGDAAIQEVVIHEQDTALAFKPTQYLLEDDASVSFAVDGGLAMSAPAQVSLNLSDFEPLPGGGAYAIPTEASIVIDTPFGKLSLQLDKSCPYNECRIDAGGTGTLAAAYFPSAHDATMSSFLSMWGTIWLELDFVQVGDTLDFAAAGSRNGLEIAPSVQITPGNAAMGVVIDYETLPNPEGSDPCHYPNGGNSTYTNEQIRLIRRIQDRLNGFGCSAG